MHAAFWGADHNMPYPFTVSGEIACVIHPEYGPSVYFHPIEFANESYIGTPINKAAAKSLKQAGITPNVPYKINKGDNLDDAIEVGLKMCDEQQIILHGT